MPFPRRPAFPVILCCIILLFSDYGFAQKSTETRINGLRAHVEILRDEWGVNHIYAANQHDLFFAQGYAAAKDRLFQFEIWRRRATGTVAEIMGPDEVQRDIGARLFKFRGDLKKELDHYHPEGKSIINAYTDGVNAWIDETLRDSTKLPIEFRMLDIKPGKWTAEVVISRHQGLLGNINDELETGIAVARAGEARVKELMWFHPKEPQLTLDPAVDGDILKTEILSVYNAYRRGIRFAPEDVKNSDSSKLFTIPDQRNGQGDSAPFEHGVEGSNNWVVNGDRTESGYPMMANDPHRSIAVPSLRYMVHLVAPGWNVVGGGEPVIPGVSIGHNEHAAWGLTIYQTDGEDLYVYDLNPRDLNQYRYKGGWVSMTEVRETIRVKGAEPVPATLRYTIHGPVTYVDSAHNKAYAVRCAWLEPGGAPYLASLRMDQATTWDEFREACSFSHIPGENMVWADKKGNIGWQVVGIVPVRENFSGLVPVPGDGRYEWSGYLPIKERPHMLNPDKGFFATANQNVTPDTYTRWNAVGYTWADPFRGNRIDEVLTNDKKFTMDEMKDLQTDYFSIPARTLVPLLTNIEFDSALARAAQTRLSKWNYVLSANSVAAGIYAMWERRIMSHARATFVPAELTGLVDIQLSKVVHWLQAPDERFGADPVTGRDAFLKTAFRLAVNELTQKLGDSIDQWRYGQENYKHITLINSLHGMAGRRVMEKAPRGGNSHTPNSTGGNDNQSSGASFRIIVDTGDWNKTLMINTPGQSGDPRSAYYANLFERWAKDEYFPSYYSREVIEEVTEERTLLIPAGKR